MTIDKQDLRRLAEASKFGAWFKSGDLLCANQKTGESHGLNVEDDRFIAAANPSTILALLDELEQVTNNRDMWQEQCRSQSAALEEVRANERQAMAYLHDVREIVGGCDYPEMIQRIRHLESCKRDAERLDKLDGIGYAYGFEDMHEGNRWMIDGPFRDIRSAIDAMQDQEP